MLARMSKKALALLMVFCMVVSALSIGALAAVETPNGTYDGDLTFEYHITAKALKDMVKGEKEYGYRSRMPYYAAEVLYGDSHSVDKREEGEEPCDSLFERHENTVEQQPENDSKRSENRHEAFYQAVDIPELFFRT